MAHFTFPSTSYNYAGLPQRCTISYFSLNCRITAQLVLSLGLGLGLELVLVCGIATSNLLLYVVNKERKNKMWCTFQVDPIMVKE